MRFHAATRTRIYDDVTVDIDPTGSTVELKVDDTWYPATWQGSPVVSGSRWTQTARTTGYFAGPDATADGATVLPLGRTATKRRVTKGGDILTANASPIDVSS